MVLLTRVMDDRPRIEELFAVPYVITDSGPENAFSALTREMLALGADVWNVEAPPTVKAPT